MESGYRQIADSCDVLRGEIVVPMDDYSREAVRRASVHAHHSLSPLNERNCMALSSALVRYDCARKRGDRSAQQI